MMSTLTSATLGLLVPNNLSILELIIHMEQHFEVYNKIKLLGEGAFGKAFLVQAQSTKELCVIKQVNISQMSEREREETLKEA